MYITIGVHTAMSKLEQIVVVALQILCLARWATQIHSSAQGT